MRALFAIGACGAMLFVAAVFRAPVNALTASIALLLALCGPDIPVWPPKWQTRMSAPHIVMLIPLIIITITAIKNPLQDYDGRAFWLLKAKAIAHDHAIDGPFFLGEESDSPRNDYPLLLPLDAATVMLLTNNLDDRVPRFLYIAIFIAFVFMIAKKLGGWWAALLAWIPMFAVAPEGGALGAYADIALAAFVGGAFFELIEAKHPYRFGTWVAFVALTKREGTPLALILLVAGLYVFRRGAIFVAPAIALLSLAIWKSRVLPGDEENLVALFPTFIHKLDRLPGAMLGFARHLATPMWGLFWIAALVALVYKRRELALPAFIIGAAFAVDIVAYTVTTWVQADLINSSADRLLMHVVAPALYAMQRSTLKT